MNIATLFNAMPGALAQGLIWAIMAIGVYLTFRILDVADLTVDGTWAPAARSASCVDFGGMQCLAVPAAARSGLACWLAWSPACSTRPGHSGHSAGILTQLALYSVNLNIMGKSQSGHQRGQI